MKRELLLLSGLCIAQLASGATTVDFSNGIPKGMYTLAGNSISLDTDRYKRGTQSLKWDWKGNDKLIYDAPIGYEPQVLVYESVDGHGGSADNPVLSLPKSFAMWIYNTKATQQRMRIQFGRGENVDCYFDYELNFEGWRTVLIGFDRGDMIGVPRTDMDRLTILAPSAGSGTFYLDMINTEAEMNPKVSAPSAQLPNIQIHPRLVSQYESRLYENSKLRPTFNLEALTAADRKTFRAMEAAVDDMYYPEYEQAGQRDSRIDAIRKDFASYKIRREGDNIYGVPVMNSNHYEPYTDLKETAKSMRQHSKDWRYDYTTSLFNIAKLYVATDSAELKEELASMYMDLFDLGYDQGMAPGESLGWMHHYSYVIRALFPAMFYMRDELRKAGRFEKAEATCRYLSQLNMYYNPDVVYGIKGRVAGDADYLQGLSTEALLTLLMQEDTPEKLRDLKHYVDYYSKITSNYAAALDEALKPDGTTFHHAGHAVGYGGRALAGLVRAAYIIGAGDYAVDQEVIDRLKKGTILTFKYTMGDKYETPKAFASIRFDSYSMPSLYYSLPAMLAIASKDTDSDLASVYHQVYDKYSNPSGVLKFWEEKLLERYPNAPREYNYTQTTMLPYSGVMMHREASDWLMTARVHSKYKFPFESWGPTFFRFPLYIGNGYLDISYGNDLDSTTGEDNIWISGYDWHRYPGTTTVRLPYDQMETNPGQVRDEAGEYLFSDQPFVGGVTSTYNTGVQVFQFKGHDKFGIESFTGKKSWFFYDDMVMCLGTDITSGVEDCDVETTLFQSSMEQNVKRDAMMSVGGKSTSMNKSMTSAKNVWFIDNRGTGYLLPSIAKGTTLNVTQGTQTNPLPVGDGNCSGEFTSAVLNHGEQAKGASYSYVMVASASEEKMAAMAKKPEMRVLQQDSEAHIVSMPKIGAVGYAIYAPEGAALGYGVVKSVNKQATFMTREQGDELTLSVSDPDLNIYDGQDDLLPNGTRCELSIYEREWFCWKSRPHKVVITLKGKWAIDRQVVEMETAENKKAKILSSDAKQTVVEVECRDGLSAECVLKRE